MKTKKTMYPKTLRVSNESYFVTEKIDGSNLGLAKVNGELLIFTRNNILTTDESLDYPGLRLFLDTYQDQVLDFLVDDTVIFGEWLGQGRIKYKVDKQDMSKRFYAFAIAGLTEDFMETEGTRFRYMKYVHEFPQNLGEQPEWLNYAPFLGKTSTLEEAQELYEPISRLDNESVSEGIVIVNGNNPMKLVMNKER